MPSLNDIPEQLLNEPNRLAFLNWLGKFALDFNHKRTLASLWTRHTKIPLTQSDWHLIKMSSLEFSRQNAPRIPPPTR